MFKKILAVAACTVAVSGTLVASPAEAATKPGLVVDYGITPAKVKVKPTQIRPYKDVIFTTIHWTKLTSTTGYATAVRKVNTCIPDCAHANYKKDKVKLTFTKVRTTPNHKKVFSKVTVTVIKTHKTSTMALPTKGEFD